MIDFEFAFAFGNLNFVPMLVLALVLFAAFVEGSKYEDPEDEMDDWFHFAWLGLLVVLAWVVAA